MKSIFTSDRIVHCFECGKDIPIDLDDLFFANKQGQTFCTKECAKQYKEEFFQVTLREYVERSTNV
jgi:hypothetical protein